MSIHAFDDGYIRSQQHPQVGRRVAVLDPPSDFGSSPDTFSRGNVRLEPDTLYMTYFYPGDAADNFEIQLVDSAEWDAGAEPGLELVDQFPGYGEYHDRASGPGWLFYQGSYPAITLTGFEGKPPAPPTAERPTPGPTLVGNLGQTTDTDDQLVGKRGSEEIAFATSFTAGNFETGYAIDGVRIEITGLPPVLLLGGIRASIYSDDDGEPGTSLHAPSSAILAADTTFWLVIEIAESPTEDYFRVATTQSMGQDDCAARSWSIGDIAYSRSDPDQPWSQASRLLKFTIQGRPAGVSPHEPACGDLPDNTGTTGRLVVDGPGVRGQNFSNEDVDWFAVDLEADTDYQFDTATWPIDFEKAAHQDTVTTSVSLAIYNAASARLRGGTFTGWGGLPDRHGGHLLRGRRRPPGGLRPDREYVLYGRTDDHPATTATVDVGGSVETYLMKTVTTDRNVQDVDWIRVSLEAGTQYQFAHVVGWCVHDAVIEGIYDSVGTRVTGQNKG